MTLGGAGAGTVEGFTLTSRGPVVAHNTLDRPTDLKLVDLNGLKPLTTHNSAVLSNQNRSLLHG